MRDKIIMIAAVIGLIAMGTLYLKECSVRRNLEADFTEERKILGDQYDSCVAAKVFTEVIVDTFDRIITVVEYPEPTQVVRWDTVWIEGESVPYPSYKYSDTLETDDFALFWRAEGILDVIEFPYYRLYDQTVVEHTVIEKPVPVYSYIDKSHLFFTMSFNTHDFTRMTGMRFGFDYINRKGWGLGVGYLRIEKRNYFDAGIKLRLL